MKQLSRALCAVDIDERSRQVFAHALALARRHDAHLYVLHAASPETSFNRGATERTDFLNQLRVLAEAAGVGVRVTVQRGYVAEIILLHARARQPDVIVMGTTRKESRRGLSGWIAEQVMRKAQCPTLVVPYGSVAATGTFDTILCAVDFSPASQAAAREAVLLAKRGRRQVTLMHVVPAPGTHQRLQCGWLATHEYYRDLGADALDKLRSLIPPADRAAVQLQVVVGDPSEEILRASRDTSASLLVIGAGGRSRLGSRLFGKTGLLLRDATCPVFAVPVTTAAIEAAEGAALKTAA